MKTAVLVVLLGAGLVIVAVGATPDRGEPFPRRFTPCGSSKPDSELIALSTMLGDKCQQLTVIDPKLKVMSVYHIELATGNIELRCVRNIHWDLQLEYYNGKGLLPSEIQSMLEPR